MIGQKSAKTVLSIPLGSIPKWGTIRPNLGLAAATARKPVERRSGRPGHPRPPGRPPGAALGAAPVTVERAGSALFHSCIHKWVLGVEKDPFIDH